MENNELEDNEKAADNNQPSESRSGGATDYVKGTTVTNAYLRPGSCVFNMSLLHPYIPL